MGNINIAIVGVGNCASSLVQGIHYYAGKTEADAIGLMHWNMAGYHPYDIDVVAAFDIDRRKVGQDVADAVFAKPNCTTVFAPDLPLTGTKVSMGLMLDGVADHMADYPDHRTFLPSDAPQPTKADVVRILKESGAEVVLNYLPVGSEQAARFYADCAIDAGCAFINNMPVFIASDPEWEARFVDANLPIVGDDIKSQLGATISHRILTDLFKKRGVKLERTYQLNTGGNTDFLNMKAQHRLTSKKKSKTQSVQAVAKQKLSDENIHIGPSDYVPFQNDNKVAFIRMEGKLFGDVPMHLEMRLSVEDSPNSAGVAIDSIRCCKIALDRGIGGILHPPSAYLMKSPPVQVTDDDAYKIMEAFIADEPYELNEVSPESMEISLS